MRTFKVIVFALSLLTAHICTAQTDVAASVTGAFTFHSTSSSATLNTDPTAGGLLELRHFFSPRRGFAVAYSYRHVSQKFISGPQPVPWVLQCSPGGINCTGPTPGYRFSISATSNIHQFTADWTPSQPAGNFRYFEVLGLGALVDLPADHPPDIILSRVSSPVLDFGAGVDWQHWQRFGVRAQYRGNLYQAPNLAAAFFGNDRALAMTNNLCLGVYFRPR